MAKPVGEFERDGVTKTAWTPAEAVDLKFHGWTEKKETKKSSSSGSSSSSSSKSE